MWKSLNVVIRFYWGEKSCEIDSGLGIGGQVSCRIFKDVIVITMRTEIGND